MLIKKCPVCGSSNLSMEKCLNCKTKCLDCGHSEEHSAFEFKEPLDLTKPISHAEMRDHLGMWSRSARQLMRLYITQQEASGIKKDSKIDILESLIGHYGELTSLRNDQLKEKPIINKEDAAMFDERLCSKIAKFKEKLKNLS